jgi:hypothetical protein
MQFSSGTCLFVCLFVRLCQSVLPSVRLFANLCGRRIRCIYCCMANYHYYTVLYTVLPNCLTAAWLTLSHSFVRSATVSFTATCRDSADKTRTSERSMVVLSVGTAASGPLVSLHACAVDGARGRLFRPSAAKVVCISMTYCRRTAHARAAAANEHMA